MPPCAPSVFCWIAFLPKVLNQETMTSFQWDISPAEVRSQSVVIHRTLKEILGFDLDSSALVTSHINSLALLLSTNITSQTPNTKHKCSSSLLMPGNEAPLLSTWQWGQTHICHKIFNSSNCGCQWRRTDPAPHQMRQKWFTGPEFKVLYCFHFSGQRASGSRAGYHCRRP